MIKIAIFTSIVLTIIFTLSLPLIIFAQSGSTSPTSADKTYQKIQERIKKTKDRLQYIDKYGSWNDANTTDYYQKTKLVFNRMLTIGEICNGNQDAQKLKECDDQTKDLYDAAKAGYRLT